MLPLYEASVVLGSSLKDLDVGESKLSPLGPSIGSTNLSGSLTAGVLGAGVGIGAGVACAGNVALTCCNCSSGSTLSTGA